MNEDQFLIDYIEWIDKNRFVEVKASRMHELLRENADLNFAIKAIKQERDIAESDLGFAKKRIKYLEDRLENNPFKTALYLNLKVRNAYEQSTLVD